MADIDLALGELRRTLLSIKFFDVALASLIVIAASLVVTTYFRLEWYYALAPWAIYFAWSFTNKVNVNSYHEVEQKVPQLREALQTAADTRKQEGVLVKELQLDVLAKMRSIKTSYFLGLGSTTRQMLLLTGLSFIVIGLAAFNVNFDTTKDFVANQAILQGAFGSIGAFAPTDNESVNGKIKQGRTISALSKFVKLKDNRSLYGDENMVDLGDTPLELQIQPEYSGSNLKDVQDPEAKKFRDQQTADITAAAQGACTDECNIPKDQQQIVKTYFEKVGTQ
jgi:hypothetical protein